MDLGVPTLLVDTADGYQPEYPAILAFIDSHRPACRAAAYHRLL